ncbi:magnesium transporter [Floricoccus penangensis]|uniref:magnesium transporter n=1 Tax=Floricoccus penangensis TaxID=1859475 RepID=UPI0020425446|nr:magnesium transporter [Floricoccus penangensis]URZ87157.1 magnesium transporter [Floricoccus penangensis]
MNEEINFEKNFVQLKELLKNNNINEFRESFLNHHLYDQSRFFLSLEPEERLEFYSLMSPKEIADIFDLFDSDDIDINPFVDEMSKEYLGEIFDSIYSDNAADLLANLEPETMKEILDSMDAEESTEVKRILHYDDETAGAIMTTEFVSIVANQTVRSAMTVLKAQAEEAETIYYVYVIDSQNRLLGVISLRALITSHDDTLIGDIYNDHIIKLDVNEDQEKIAQYFRDYDLLAIPVVDTDNKLIGIVTVDDIIDVIDDEAASDYSGLAGVDTEDVSQNPWQAASKRLPWLIALLFLGMGTASLINHFDSLVSKASILAVFISLITGTAGNAGTQSLAVAVRRLAIRDEEKKNSLMTMILSELITGLITGLVTGITIFIVVSIWKHNMMLGIAVGTAMFCAITVANLAGSLIPILMEKLGFDPAVASGPFISTMSDLTSVFIYFNIASLFMHYFN